MQKTYQVLIIEENPAEVKLIKECLTYLNYYVKITVARTGDEALNSLHSIGKFENSVLPDFIISAMNVPGRKAFEIIADVKMNENLAQIPFVILSYADSPDDILRCYKEGAHSVINKPPDFNLLIKIVKSIMEIVE